MAGERDIGLWTTRNLYFPYRGVVDNLTRPTAPAILARMADLTAPADTTAPGDTTTPADPAKDR